MDQWSGIRLKKRPTSYTFFNTVHLPFFFETFDSEWNMQKEVQEYYGKTLQKTEDLKTNACCTGESIPKYIKKALSNVHEDVLTRYYGCGLVAPELLKGMNILDLGSGSGRDCYVLAQLVGEEGSVVGVDMTDEQLSIAQKYELYHQEKFGFKKGNVTFKKGFIEKLDEIGLPENHFDIIISNCVVNLSTDKEAVFEQAYNLLKPGGEIYFSDVYSDRRVPQTLLEDPVLYGECLSGALYWNDFLTLAKKVGFNDPRLVLDRPITIDNPCIESKLDGFKFYSATYRLFKIEGLESACEDYGQAVVYKGTIPNHPLRLALDGHHVMEKGKVFPVCGNTYRMLSETRFKDHFDFLGSWDTHYGIYEGCGTGIPFQSSDCGCDNGSGGGSCC